MTRIGDDLTVGIGELKDGTVAVILTIGLGTPASPIEDVIVLSELQAIEISAALREGVNRIRRGEKDGCLQLGTPKGYHGPGR